MTTDQLHSVVPIIEGKLYAWATARKNYPGAAISSVYKKLHEHRNHLKEIKRPDGDPALQTAWNRKHNHEPQPGGGPSSSPQERWAEKHADQIRDAEIIEQTLRRCSPLEQRLVGEYYVLGKSWLEVSTAMHLSRTAVYRLKMQLMRVLAHEFDLVPRDIG